MGFGNADVLKARVNNYASFINEIEDAKLTEIESEVTDLIYQKTSVPVPEDPANAPGILRGIWADIVLWKIIKWQSDLSDEEKEQRKLMFNSAMSMLDQIQTGEIKLKNSDGTTITSQDSVIKFRGVKRVTITP